MRTIHVTKAFTLLLPTGPKTHYPVGKHVVSEQVAAHWFVKANTR